MGENRKKLVTWKQWVLAVTATAFGASLSLYREYRDTGDVQAGSIATSAMIFCFAMGIMASVFWYANRPESERKQ